MSLTLIATAGAVDANTYCTLEEAETYFAKRLHNTDWSEASNSDKGAALVWATSILDTEINWYGWPVSETQALRWPRIGLVSIDGWTVSSTTIPQFLKDATAEFAMSLITSDRTADEDMIGIKQIAVSSIQITNDKYNKKSVVPKSVWQLIRPYGTRYASSSANLVRE